MRLRDTLAVCALISFAADLAQAQPARPRPAPADPFAAIVGDPDGANAQLNDVALPVRNPTEAELRQYLAAFQVLNVTAVATLDDGKGRRAEFNTPSPVAFGPLSAPNGTKVRVSAGFQKRPGEKEAVLRTLELVPDREMRAMGLVKFDRAYLDDKGVMHMQARFLGRQEVTVEKVYRDADGLVRFKLSGDGLGAVLAKGALGGELRVRRDGTVERHMSFVERIWPGNWGEEPWSVVKGIDGVPVKVPFLANIKSWPPKASELIDLFPQTGAPPPGPDPLTAARAALDAVPVSALELRFTGKADPTAIRLSGGEGQLLLSDHELELVSNGRFKGRTYHSDPGLPNEYRLKGRVTGEVNRAGTRARIDDLRFDVNGTHAETIPFEDPTRTVLDATMRTSVHAALSDVRTELPTGTFLVVPGQASANFQGEGSLTLRPLGAGPDRSELTIDRRKNHYDLTVNGPVELGGLSAMSAPTGVTIPDALKLAPLPGQPLLRASGTLGTKMGFLFTKTELDLDGTTVTPGAISVLEGTGAARREVKTTLKPGARAKLHLYTFAGIKESSLEGLLGSALGLPGSGVSTTASGAPELGAVNSTFDLGLQGEATGTSVTSPEMSLNAPGARVDARAAGAVRLGTRSGAEAEVRRAAVAANLELTAPAELEAGLPGQPRLTGTAGTGTRLSVSSGELQRDPRTGVLSGDGARLEAHLVLTQGSLAHRDLALALQGRATVDLTAAIGFKVDPRAALAGRPPVSEPIDLDLALGIELAAGTVIKGGQAGSSAQVKLRGATTVTAHARAKVDPRTGQPTLGSLGSVDLTITADGMDLQALLAPLGLNVTASSQGRSTFTLRQASFEPLSDGGLRIRHKGVAVELAAGEIVLRPNAPRR